MDGYGRLRIEGFGDFLTLERDRTTSDNPSSMGFCYTSKVIWRYLSRAFAFLTSSKHFHRIQVAGKAGNILYQFDSLLYGNVPIELARRDLTLDVQKALDKRKFTLRYCFILREQCTNLSSGEQPTLRRSGVGYLLFEFTHSVDPNFWV